MIDPASPRQQIRGLGCEVSAEQALTQLRCTALFCIYESSVAQGEMEQLQRSHLQAALDAKSPDGSKP